MKRVCLTHGTYPQGTQCPGCHPNPFPVGQPIYADHRVLLHRSLTTAVVITPDANGNVRIVEEEGEEIVDIADTHLYCDTCGLLGVDEFADHGIAEMWEEM